MVSCDKDDDPQPKDNDQTLFIYMPWSTDLGTFFEDNIKAFEKALQEDIKKNERIVVFFATSLTEATLYEMEYVKGKNIRTTLKQYKNPAHTAVNGLTSILNDVKHFAPAQRYAMIVSCHGSGWLPVSSQLRSSEHKFHWEYQGGLLTRAFGGRTENSKTDITTLADALTNAAIKMEYILFDDCYMSSIEVAYDLKDVTDYLIGCPTEVMAHGYPYDLIGKYLIGNVDYDGVVNGFYTFYQNFSTPCGTIGVTKCSELDNLASVMKQINQKFTLEPSLLNKLQRLDGYSPIIFYDYGDYVAKLCTDQELLKVFQYQLERTVPSKWSKHTPYYYSQMRGQVKINTYSGVTISDPSMSPVAASKTETAWYRATH